MLSYAVVSLVIAMVAAVLGVGAVASGAAGIVFLILAAIGFLLGAIRGNH
jgi:uncharacterized membrane protein YtjA (UPF0391 family)